MIHLGGIRKKIALDVPHQRVGAVCLLAEALFRHVGVDAPRYLAQLQQHLALRLKHLFVRALHAIDAQRDGHARADGQQFADEQEHLPVRSIQPVDIHRLPCDKRLRQHPERFVRRVVQTQIPRGKIVLRLAIQN